MRISIMDHTGHSTVEFKPQETDAAMAKLKALLGDGFTIAGRNEGETDYVVTRDPDDTKTDWLAVPQMKGG